MLQGQWPGHGCEYCRDIEAAGGTSDRQFQNQIPNIWPGELDTDPTATKVDPVVLEVFFSNTCNLSCVYCAGHLSSKIQQEERKYNQRIVPVVKDSANLYESWYNNSSNKYNELAPKFWNWFHDHGKNLQRIQILGGEPFLQDDLLRLIEYYSSNPAPTLEFNVVTNGSLPTQLWQKSIDQLVELVHTKNIGRVDLQMSIDCWGPEQEYLRHGLDIMQFEKNLRYAQSTNSIRIGLLSTVTSLGILGLPTLAKKYLEWKEQHDLFWYPHFVLPIDASVFSPTMFDYSLFKESMSTLKEMLPTITWDDKQLVESFNGMDKKLREFCQDNKLKQHDLLQYINDNDKRRGTNWRATFPWLVKHLGT